jgi:di/tricarboxylate transporter
VIFLFLGSFLLAEALSRYRLDVRLAAWLLGLPLFARTPAGRMAAFGTASAAISTVLSNTATAALMTPIAVGALGERKERPTKAESGVLLMIAYGASVGGMATIIGTPPNLLVAGFLERLAGTRVGFADWLAFGAPISLVLLLVSLGLTRLVLGRGLASGDVAQVAAAAEALGDDEASRERRRGARYTVLAFSLAFALWLAPSLAQGVLGATTRSPSRSGSISPRPESRCSRRACCSWLRSPGASGASRSLGGRPARQLGRAAAVRRRAVARHARRGHRRREVGGRERRERGPRDEPRGLHADSP